MIFIHELLTKNLINPELKSENKQEVLNELADILINNNFVKDRNQLIDKLTEREAIETTGIGYGVAITHARTESVDEIAMCFGISREGIDFESLDNKPAHIFFLIASNENNKNNYIKLLARISRICRKESFRSKVVEAENAEDIIEVFKEEESI